jgi:hypothetical protein
MNADGNQATLRAYKVFGDYGLFTVTDALIAAFIAAYRDGVRDLLICWDGVLTPWDRQMLSARKSSSH